MVSLSCRNCAQSGIGNEVVLVNGAFKCCCQTINPVTLTPRTFAESKSAFIDRAFAAEATPEPATGVIQVAVVAKIKARRGRCPVYAIRRFMAVARELGNDLKNADGMCAAIAAYLGIELESRSHLTPDQWGRATLGARLGEIRF